VILVRKYSIRHAYCDHPKNKKYYEDCMKISFLLQGLYDVDQETVISGIFVNIQYAGKRKQNGGKQFFTVPNFTS
jgi:hypothetical protein